MTFKSYLIRSANYIADSASSAITGNIAWKQQMPLFDFNSTAHLNEWILGSDADYGGLSSAYWSASTSNTALFYGTCNTRLPDGYKASTSGYCGIRSRVRPITLFHIPRFDVSLFRYLLIRAKGDENTYFINIQTDSMFPTFLYQHRLKFKSPGTFETILIPFRDFILTSGGTIQPNQLQMDTSKIKTIGISILRQDTDFCLELDSIKAFNTKETYGDYDIGSSYIDMMGNQRKMEEEKEERKSGIKEVEF